MKELRVCKICGVDFLSVRSSHLYCSRECSQIGLAESIDTKRRRRRKSNYEAIREIVRRAEKNGLSYGKQVARDGTLFVADYEMGAKK